jgi:hypothetical protein
METNFNLKKFLTENKLTSLSKQLNEQENIPNDIVWTDEDEDTSGSGTFNQLGLDASELDSYEVTLLGYSPSTGKAYSGTTSGEYGEVDYDNIDQVEEMNPRLTKNYIEDLKKYQPEHYKRFTRTTRGVEEGEKKMSKRENK